MEDKKVTFNDIAKYTNFSKTTISRYFNNPDSLTIKNQEIIAQALIDLNYQENKLAKMPNRNPNSIKNGISHKKHTLSTTAARNSRPIGI